MIPRPLPGETAFSHRERVAAYNFQPCFERTINALRIEQTGKGQKRKRVDINQILAELCGMTEAQYLARHSLNAVHRLILVPGRGKQTEGSLFNASSRVDYYGKSFWTDVIRCKDCDDQTRSQSGFTHLHRMHYLPVVDVCAIHGTPLNKITNQRTLSWRQNSSGQQVQQSSIASIEAHAHPVIARYIEACRRMLECETVPDKAVFAKNVVNKLTERGLLNLGNDEWGEVSQFLHDTLPVAWREQHMPGLSHWPKGDGRLLKSRGHAAVLLLSALFENVDQVLEMIYQPISQEVK